MVKGQKYSCTFVCVYTCGYMFAFSFFSFRVKNEGRHARVENRRTINRKEGKEEREGGERERGGQFGSRAGLLSSNSRCYGDNLERPPPSTQNPPLPSLISTETFFRNRLIQKEFFFFFFFFFQFFHSQGKPSRISLNVLLRSSSFFFITFGDGKISRPNSLFRSPRGSTRFLLSPRTVVVNDLSWSKNGRREIRSRIRTQRYPTTLVGPRHLCPHKWN